MPLHIDDLPYLPGWAYVAADGTITTGIDARRTVGGELVADVISRLGDPPIMIAGRDIDPVDLVAALLTRVVAEASAVTGTRVGRLTLAIPAQFGPRRWALLRTATDRAGLPVPVLLPAPAGAAAYATYTGNLAVPVGGRVLVCDLGASAASCTVLVRTADLRWDIRSTVSDPDGGGHRLDTDLATTLLGALPPDLPAAGLDVREVVRVAKEALRRDPSAPVVLPPPHAVAVLTRDMLTAHTAPLLTHVRDTIRRAKDAADITDSDLAATIIVGGGAHLPDVATSVHHDPAFTALVPPRPEQAAALGAARTGRTATAVTGGEWVRSAPPDKGLRQLAVVIVAGVASILLLAHALTSVYIHTLNGYIDYIFFNNGEFAIACALIVVTAIAVARLYTLTHLAMSTDTRMPRPSRVFFSATGTALVTAVIYALLAGVTLNQPAGPYVGTAIKVTLPLAAIAIIIGALTPRLGHLGGAAFNHLRHPPTAIALAATGIATMQYANNAPLGPTIVSFYSHAGGALLGAGCAWTLTRHRTPRLIAVPLLALAGALAATLNTTTLLGYAYIACLYIWWLTAAAATARDAYPSLGTLISRQRLRQSPQPDVPPIAATD